MREFKEEAISDLTAMLFDVTDEQLEAELKRRNQAREKSADCVDGQQARQRENSTTCWCGKLFSQHAPGPPHLPPRAKGDRMWDGT